MASGSEEKNQEPTTVPPEDQQEQVEDSEYPPLEWKIKLGEQEVDLNDFRPAPKKCLQAYEDRYDFPDGELVQLSETFTLVALGGNTITMSGFKKCLQIEGEIPSDKEWEQIKEHVDPEAKGWINFQQLLDALKSPWIKREVLTEAQLEECFASIDSDRSGSVSTSELKHILATLGDGLTDREAQEMIREADASGDGEIDYAEFVKTILSTQ